MKIIDGLRYYTKKEVADLVGRTPLTIHHYDSWSNERESEGEERFIPKPLLVGKYRYWNDEQVEQIKGFFEWVEQNRGAISQYSKRCWGNRNTKDDKKAE